jgi:GGDEF domain-containing protein
VLDAQERVLDEPCARARYDEIEGDFTCERAVGLSQPCIRRLAVVEGPKRGIIEVEHACEPVGLFGGQMLAASLAVSERTPGDDEPSDLLARQHTGLDDLAENRCRNALGDAAGALDPRPFASAAAEPSAGSARGLSPWLCHVAHNVGAKWPRHNRTKVEDWPGETVRRGCSSPFVVPPSIPRPGDPTLSWNAARNVTSWFVPEGLLLGVAVASLHVEALREPLREFAPFAPLVVFALGFLLALRFQRSRLVLALLALAFVEWGLDRTRTGDVGRFVWQAAAVLLPLNLAAVMLMSERGIFTRTGLARIAMLLAQVGGIAAAARYAPSRAAAIVDYQPFPAGWFAWTPLAPLPLIAFVVAAALIITGLVLQASPTGRAFLWALVAAFLALHSVDTPVAATIYGSTAGLILVVAVIEASYLMAYQDSLTGLPARRALNEALHQMNGKFTIAMVDVDHFKKLNDRYGHDVGDQVPRMLASRLAKVSNGGRAFRYGGEEFAILFPGDGIEECLPELEELRRSVEDAKFTVRRRLQRPPKPARNNGGGNGRKRPQIAVTVSIGAAESNGRQDAPALVVEAADRALYRAKDAGRNRVES